MGGVTSSLTNVASRLLSDLVRSIEAAGSAQESEWLELASRPGTLSRDGHPSHFTASALPVSPDGRHVCLVLHGRMGLWVQPGGHFESYDPSVPEAAGREMREETGLTGQVDPVPLRLSRHRAPCRAGAWHYDVQFRAVAAMSEPVVSSESRDVAWFRVDRLPPGLAPGVEDLVVAAVSRNGLPGSR